MWVRSSTGAAVAAAAAGAVRLDEATRDGDDAEARSGPAQAAWASMAGSVAASRAATVSGARIAGRPGSFTPASS